MLAYTPEDPPMCEYKKPRTGEHPGGPGYMLNCEIHVNGGKRV
jgi:hypothetical protein